MRRMAIIWFIESLFGSPRKRLDWTLSMAVAGITIALAVIALRWSP